MPSIRVIAGAAIGFLFVWVVWLPGVAQTASTEPVGKPMQLPQPMHPGKSETKPRERSAAKHSSKAHLAAERLASTKLAFKESTSNGAAHVTAVAAQACGDAVDGLAVGGAVMLKTCWSSLVRPDIPSATKYWSCCR